MRRREFITLLGSATVAWPLAAQAQHAAMPAVGFLIGREATRPARVYGRVCGWALARAHAHSGNAAMISGYMGSSENL